MGDIKPLGSEKLTGDNKLKRILELTYYNQPKKSIENNKPEIVKESVSGGVYGIVKEKDGYYVKKGLTEGTLDYIGGMFMKNKNKFSSYSEALKRMNLLNGQETLQEATKYVLKQKTPTTQEAPMAEPSMDAPPTGGSTPPPPTGDSTLPSDMPPVDDTMGGESDGESDGEDTMSGESDSSSPSKRSEYMGEIQKFSGKLGQELRDQHQRLESDDIKYVLNMIISAVDLDKLEDKDIKDIGKKFKRDEEEGDETAPEMPTEPEVPTAPEETGVDSELGETLSKLNSFINSPAYTEHDTDEVDLSKYVDLGDVSEEESYMDEDEIYENIDEYPNPDAQSHHDVQR
jgi:hypothetical protein